MNNNIELYIFKYLFKYNNYTKFSSFIEEKFLKDNSPELHRLFVAISEFHNRYPNKDITQLEELRVLYSTLFPSISKDGEEIVAKVFENLGAITVEEAIAREYIVSHINRVKATKISLKALDVADGKADIGSLQEELASINDLLLPETSSASEFVSLSDTDGRPPQGLRWPLNCLNRSLGSLRQGDNGFIFARPEVGKTALIVHSSVYMAEQEAYWNPEGPVIYFNNEQPGEIMYQRAVQASLGIDSETFFKYKRQALEKFKRKTREGFHIYDSAYIRRKEVEALCKRYRPKLLVFDQLDKLRGFTADRKDLELKEIYQWGRELSKEYGPVIGICQAGGTAENKKWLDMNDVDSSHTAKQGEADWILGIGKSNQEGLEAIRHFSLCKNKLLGDEDTDPAARHGKMIAKIVPHYSQYVDTQ